MGVSKLGRLWRVELREAWESEPGHFTPWLAKEENLKLLGEAIELELELDSTEKAVGPFRADILCKDLATERWVLIENQLAKTDHSHLGQIITYAAGLEAVTIVWIADRFTEEHRAALDWLNEHTDESIHFFGLEIELWKIDDSLMAPKFNIVSKPNDWSRAIQAAANTGSALSEHRLSQLKFWTAFKSYMDSAGSLVKCQKPLPQHWTNHAIGRTGSHLCSVISTWNSATNTSGSELRVELVLDGGNAKAEYALLEARKDEIERALGFKLTWHNPESKNSCKLYTRLELDFFDEENWPRCFSWLKEKLERLHAVLGPIVIGFPR